MCDTLVVIRDDKILFAKNSDRDPNEPQFLDWQKAREYKPGDTEKCTYIEIPQARHTYAVLLSRPFWMWGAEMGANEHGLVIGNEAVFTKKKVPKTGLTGMDLLRLALERCATARQAVDTIIELIQQFGQGGGGGYEDRNFAYFSSFLVADPQNAFVLETDENEYAVEKIKNSRSISNCLTIPDFDAHHSDFLYTKVAQGKKRSAFTIRLAAKASSIHDMIKILQTHNSDDDHPKYNLLNGAMGAPCMHAGGLATGSQTTASWVAELSQDKISHWVTATSTPCTALFKPVNIQEPLDLGSVHSGQYDPAAYWWRHEAFARKVMCNPAMLKPLFIDERNEVQARWLAHRRKPQDAFEEADRLLGKWAGSISHNAGVDVRPRYVKRYWKKRDQIAKL